MNKKTNLGIIFFPAFDWKISPNHPEREERLLYTQDQIFEEGLADLDEIEFYNPTIASIEDIKRVHFIYPSVKDVLTSSHFIAAGAAIKSLNLVMENKVNKAFSLTRPPGHHAQTVVYGDRGFCIVNNVAVMVEKIRQKYGNLKVAIIDTDAHHADGTQDIYWNDKNTLLISLHQDGRTLYPGSGFINELGSPNAFGYNINIPLPPNTTDEGYHYIIDNLVLPILKDFNPDIIINSAGQDNHYSDPLTNMNLSAQGYASLNEKLNPDVAVLEGGYSIEGALPYINLGIIFAMSGIDYTNVIEPDFKKNKIKQSKEITTYIEKLSNNILNIWKNKDIILKETFPKQDIYTFKHNVYYDTSNIQEQQTRKYYSCSKCQSISTIESKNNLGKHIFAITIPIDCCKSCLLKGKNLYNKTNVNLYSCVFLQNKKEDLYLKKTP